MSGRSYEPRSERLARDGAVFITMNHIALLQGLLDRPDGIARSCRDFIDAGRPFIGGYSASGNSCFAKSSRRVNPAWVVRVRIRGRIECHITDRGRAILDGTVRARIWGAGEYLGARARRERRRMQATHSPHLPSTES